MPPLRSLLPKVMRTLPLLRLPVPPAAAVPVLDPVAAALLAPVLLALGLFAPAPASAQLVGLGDALSEADMLYLAGEPRAALDRLAPRLEAERADFGALWRAARSAVVIGIDQDDEEAQQRWLQPALGWAELAVEARPGHVDGLYWRGVAAGRMAMNAGPGRSVELAEIVYGDAHAILQQDSLHGGAHNMLGKFNYEVMTLSRVKRLLARTFMSSAALDDTSWEQAEHHLARAAEIWPEFVLFHFDLAQLHRRRGRRDDAIASYRRAIELPAVHPTDLALQRQASDVLREWEASIPQPGTDGGPTECPGACGR